MEPQTLVVTNFAGNLSRAPNGDLNSGLARYSTSHGYNPFAEPNTLSFMEGPRDIRGGVVTDCILASTAKLAQSVTQGSFFAIGHTGRLYLFQTNDTATQNPDFDTPTLINTLVIYTLDDVTGFSATNAVTSPTAGVGIVRSVSPTTNRITIEITSGTFPVGPITDTTTSTTANITSVDPPTFNFGASIEFFSSAICIGYDGGVIRLAQDGSGPTIMIGDEGSWLSGIAMHVLKQFGGNLYVGNNLNIGEINSSFVVTTYTKLSPAFASGSRIVDLDYSADGTYLILTGLGTAGTNSPTATAPNTNQTINRNSILGYWNGIDAGITRFSVYPGLNIRSYLTFSAYEYLFGNDMVSASLSTPAQKLLTLQNMSPVLPNASSSLGSSILFMAPEYINGKLQAALHTFGQFDIEYPPAQYRLLSFPSVLADGDVLNTPVMIPVENFAQGGQTSGYANDIIGSGKLYFSTTEYDGSTTTYGFYAFSIFPTGSGTAISGVYETQAQLFAKKVTCKEVRIYLEPAVAGQSFQFDLIGIDEEVLSNKGGARVFTVGTNLETGETIAWYNPAILPTPALGFRITNAGSVTPIIHKVEIDVVPYGK